MCRNSASSISRLLSLVETRIDEKRAERAEKTNLHTDGQLRQGGCCARKRERRMAQRALLPQAHQIVEESKSSGATLDKQPTNRHWVDDDDDIAPPAYDFRDLKVMEKWQ